MDPDAGAGESLTRVLVRVNAGDAAAGDALLGLVYQELRQMARARLANLGPGQTLQATALVHEAWLKLQAPSSANWDGRAHFFGAAARAMRNILVDQARRPHKRAGRDALPTDIQASFAQEAETDLVALDAALDKLEQQHHRPAQVVMLRHFTGLEIAQIAELLGVSKRTVDREWAFARAWLQREIDAGR